MSVTRDANGNLIFTPMAAPQPSAPPIPPQMPVDMTVPNDPSIPAMTTRDGTNVQEMPDGSVIIGLELGGDDEEEKDESFDANLAVDLDDMSLACLCDDLLQGIDSDIQSRQQLLVTYANGMDLLGLKIEDRSNKQQRKNVSTVRHPILLESVISFQSSALGEMLPADGPVKVQLVGGDDKVSDDTAQALEEDFNAYLTTGAPEYYPDMDRGLFNLGYGGTLFKKVYRCPIRKRPVSECVLLTDLIVSEDSVSLEGAMRVTHRIKISPPDMKRMQVGGVWRDIALMTPQPTYNPVDTKQKIIAGIAPTNSTRPKDTPFEVYECYTELNPTDYNLPDEGKEDGLYLPYRVTIEKDSRKILEIRRNWREGDVDFKKRQRFVMYGLVPGFGFLCLGFLHMLGNQTRAMTAAWRIMMDGGMFSNFPGGVRVKGTRQTTNEINPGPGEFVEMDTGPMEDIHKAIMPLPYKDVSPVFMQFVELVNKNVQGIAGAVSVASGEGKANVPVGTIMAMIEQQTKVMAAVHKRMHHAQAVEFGLLKELFDEEPESLTKWAKNPARTWTREQLESYEMIPVSDPNIPSQVHRLLIAGALLQLTQQAPGIIDPHKAIEYGMRTIGIKDPTSFFMPPQPPQPPQGMQNGGSVANSPAMLALKQQELKMKQDQQQRVAAQGMLHAKEQQQRIQADMARSIADNQTKERVAEMAEQTARMKIMNDSAHREADRKTELLHAALQSGTNGIGNSSSGF